MLGGVSGTLMSLLVKLGVDSSDLKRGMTEAEKSSKKGGKNIASGLKSSLKAFTAAAAGAAAFGIAVKKAYSFAREGAELQRLEQASYQTARSFGASMDDIVEAVSTAARGTISQWDIMRAANTAMLLGVTADADTMAKMMQSAMVRGRAMGRTTAEAFDDIARGVGRASPLILDNLGYIFDANELYTSWAATLGKTAEQLTKAEKTAALLNMVVKDAAPAARDSMEAFERLEVSLDKLIKTGKKWLGAGLAPIIEGFFDLSDAVHEHDRYMVLGMGTYREYTDEYTRLHKVLDAFGVPLGMLTEKQWDAARAVEHNTWLMDAYKHVIEGTTDSMGDIVPPTEDYAVALEKVRDEAEKAQEKVDAFWGAMDRGPGILRRVLSSIEKAEWAKMGAEGINTFMDSVDTALERRQISMDEYMDFSKVAGVVALAIQASVEDLNWWKVRDTLISEFGYGTQEAYNTAKEITAPGFNTELFVDTMLAENSINAFLERQRFMDIYVRYTGGSPPGGGGSSKPKPSWIPSQLPKEIRQYTAQYGGSGIIPPGYPGDTFPVLMTSGERYHVSSPSQTRGEDARMLLLLERIADKEILDEVRLASLIRDAVLEGAE